MKRSIETQIRINTIVVYLVVVALFSGVLVYVYSFRADLDKQKKNIEYYRGELKTAEKLIRQVENAQSNVNLYAATKHTSYQENYEASLDSIRNSIDLLRVTSQSPSHERVLKKLDSLLLLKGGIVSDLNDALAQKDLLVDVNRFLRNYKPKELNAILKQKNLLNKTDSLITRRAPKKTFFKKLKSLFSTQSEIDTTRVKSQSVESSLPKHVVLRSENDGIKAKIKSYVQHAGVEYISQLEAIENRVNELIMADQKISREMSSLLMDYLSEIIHARYDEIRRSDDVIKQNNNYTLVGGLIALLPFVFSLIMILQNVNKGKRARLALEKANDRIREVMESRHRLLLSVSHDIKTPLNSIMGRLDLNKNGSSITSEKILSMQNSGKHILALLDNLLGFSSIEQGKVALQSTLFHLSEMCLDVKGMFEPLCESRNLKFVTDFDFDKKLILNTDGLKLKQVIVNLLSNAVKYTQVGQICFRVSYQDGNILVWIEDSGVGMPKEKLDKIFEPFVRVEENNKLAEGFGFGMYVVKGLLDLFGGTIKAESEVGKGSKFSLVIPAISVFSDNKGSKVKRLLVVDDDPSFFVSS